MKKKIIIVITHIQIWSSYGSVENFREAEQHLWKKYNLET